MTPSVSVQRVLFRKNSLTLLAILIFIGITVVSVWITDFDFAQGLLSFPAAFHWLTTNFVPTERAWNTLPNVVAKMGETILVSIMATVCAAIVGFVLALLSAKATRPFAFLSYPIKIFASVCRNVPIVAWAMIFLLSFGQSFLTGFLALFIETLGFLTRTFSEVIDETSSRSIEALKACGARWRQTVTQAVVPETLAPNVSWTLFLLETNIRSATLIGLLTGTGIGFLFDLYYKSMNYPAAALVTMMIVVVVLVLEIVSNFLRKVIL